MVISHGNCPINWLRLQGYGGRGDRQLANACSGITVIEVKI
jgi:hypothetical protein